MATLTVAKRTIARGHEGEKDSKSQSPSTREVGPDEVFNLHLFSNWLVLDGREKTDFGKARIAGAVWTPVSGENDALKLKGLLARLVAHLDEFGMPDHMEKVVVYGPASATQWLAQCVARLAHAGSGVLSTASPPGGTRARGEATKRPSHIQRTVLWFAERLQRCCREILVIRGGFRAFQAAYPTLCVEGPEKRGIGHLKATPALISEGVFLGNRFVDISTARALGVSAAVVSPNFCEHEVPKGASGAGSTGFKHGQIKRQRMIEGVLYLPIEIPDESYGGMWIKVFAQAVHFIGECVERKKKVLVQVYGRSRSAAVCAAWLCAAEGLTADEAVAKMKKLSPKSDTSLMMVEDLRKWRRSIRPKEAPLSDSRAVVPVGAGAR